MKYVAKNKRKILEFTEKCLETFNIPPAPKYLKALNDQDLIGLYSVAVIRSVGENFHEGLIRSLNNIREELLGRMTRDYHVS